MEPVDLSFRAKDIPCLPDVVPLALSGLRDHVESDYGRGDANIMEQMPPAHDVQAINRYLLKARKGRRYTAVYRHINDALTMLRPHSSLYTHRSCRCLAAAWRRYCEQVDEALENLNGPRDSAARWPGQGQAMWAVRCRDKPMPNAYGRLAVQDLSVPFGTGRGPWAGLRSSYYARTPHRLVTSTFRDEPQVTVTVGSGRSELTLTFTRLDPARTELASRIATDGVRGAGGWVISFPDRLVQAVSVWQNPAYTFAEVATVLLEAGFVHLSEQEQQFIAAAAQDWQQSPADLVHAARSACAAA